MQLKSIAIISQQIVSIDMQKKSAHIHQQQQQQLRSTNRNNKSPQQCQQVENSIQLISVGLKTKGERITDELNQYRNQINQYRNQINQYRNQIELRTIVPQELSLKRNQIQEITKQKLNSNLENQRQVTWNQQGREAFQPQSAHFQGWLCQNYDYNQNQQFQGEFALLDFQMLEPNHMREGVKYKINPKQHPKNDVLTKKKRISKKQRKGKGNHIHLTDSKSYKQQYFKQEKKLFQPVYSSLGIQRTQLISAGTINRYPQPKKFLSISPSRRARQSVKKNLKINAQMHSPQNWLNQQLQPMSDHNPLNECKSQLRCQSLADVSPFDLPSSLIQPQFWHTNQEFLNQNRQQLNLTKIQTHLQTKFLKIMNQVQKSSTKYNKNTLKTAKDLKDYAMKQILHNKRESFDCHCGREYNNKRGLREHVRLEHSQQYNKMFINNKANKERGKTYFQHKEWDDERQNWKLREWWKDQLYTKQVKANNQSFSQQKYLFRFQCSCGKFYKSFRVLKIHVAQVHKNLRKQKGDVLQFMVYPTQECQHYPHKQIQGKFKCPCGGIYSCSSGLYLHVRSKHNGVYLKESKDGHNDINQEQTNISKSKKKRSRKKSDRQNLNNNQGQRNEQTSLIQQQCQIQVQPGKKQIQQKTLSQNNMKSLAIESSIKYNCNQKYYSQRKHNKNSYDQKLHSHHRHVKNNNYKKGKQEEQVNDFQTDQKQIQCSSIDPLQLVSEPIIQQQQQPNQHNGATIENTQNRKSYQSQINGQFSCFKLKRHGQRVKQSELKSLNKDCYSAKQQLRQKKGRNNTNQNENNHNLSQIYSRDKLKNPQSLQVDHYEVLKPYEQIANLNQNGNINTEDRIGQINEISSISKAKNKKLPTQRYAVQLIKHQLQPNDNQEKLFKVQSGFHSTLPQGQLSNYTQDSKERDNQLQTMIQRMKQHQIKQKQNHFLFQRKLAYLNKLQQQTKKVKIQLADYIKSSIKLQEK